MRAIGRDDVARFLVDVLQSSSFFLSDISHSDLIGDWRDGTVYWVMGIVCVLCTG